MLTPFCTQSPTVLAITMGSPAWKPQATLAERTIFSTSSSLPIFHGPKLSPRSELMFTSMAMAVAPVHPRECRCAHLGTGAPRCGRYLTRPGAPAVNLRGRPVEHVGVGVRYLNCGDTAFSVEFGSTIAPEINARVMGLHARVAAERAAGRLEGVVETIPSMRALMVCYDPVTTTRAAVQPAIEALLAGDLEHAAPTRTLSIPCCYDDPEFAPDLADVAQRTGLTTEDVIARHAASD